VSICYDAALPAQETRAVEPRRIAALEDETANANLIVWPTIFEQHRRAILSATMLGCRGRVQSADGGTPARRQTSSMLVNVSSEPSFT
jgi:DNA polymerase III alpha subunit